MRIFHVVAVFMLCAAAFGGESPAPNREAEPFRVRTEISPNGFEAFRFDPATKQFSRVETTPDALAPHAELVGQALARVPSWLREDVHAQLRALLMSPIRIKGATAMAFEDVNRDGKPDLVAVEEEKKIRTFLAPLWIEDKSPTKLRVGADGKIVGLRSARSSADVKSFRGAEFGEGSVRALGDVNGDGQPDLVIVDKSGIVMFLRSMSLTGKAEFQLFSNWFQQYFKNVNVGLALRPVALDPRQRSGDWLLVGTKDGELFTVSNPPPETPSNIPPPYSTAAKHPAHRIASGALAPTLFSTLAQYGGGIVAGDADGRLRILNGKEWDVKYAGFDKINVGSFAAPAFGDLDGDGDWDLVIGNGAGELRVFKNLEVEKGKIEFEEITDKSPLEKIKVNHSASPALGDVNGDGKVDLLLGAQDGTLRLFLSPDFVEDMETFAGIRAGELSAPAFIDVNSDGKLDVVVGNARGQLLYYENVSTKDRLAWVEKYSKDLSEKNDDGSVKREIKYAGNYYREREMLFGANDTAALEDYAKLLRDRPKDFVDEIAFVIANTPAEILRTMSRTKQSDILLENAKAIYEMAGHLKYASLKEHSDFTTLEVALDKNTKKELPRDIYYWWVVHPRIYHEIPWRVDASWWDKKPDERGMKPDDWLRHEAKPDVLVPSPQSVFWRSALPNDKTHGVSLLDVVKDAPTLRDAVERMHWWMSQVSPEGFMRFGYITNDGQPNVIFKKAYGSCGEFSILSTALARTALIPTALITKMGEDHQWVEFYEDGKWVHWDASQLPGVDAPWSSNEGRRHGSHLSAVFREWGNSYSDETTTTVSNPVTDFTKAGAGYTDTGSVTVMVRDARGRAVDGAMIVIHNNEGGNRNFVTWGYTDAKGECVMRLGGKPNGGYSFEVVSPYGQSGTELFHVAEGKTYLLDYQLTGEIKNPWQEYVRNYLKNGGIGVPPVNQKGKRTGETPMLPTQVSMNMKFHSFNGLLRPPGFFTSPPQAIGGVEHFGVHQFPHSIANAGKLKWLVLDKENFEKFKSRKPFSVILSGDIAAVEQSSLVLPRREMFLVFVNLETQRIHHHLEATFEISEPSTTQGSPATDTDTPDDKSREKKEIPPMFAQPPTREFKNVKIFQDDESDHLKKTGWILGPFRVVGKERFLQIKTDSPTKEFDLDLYLYADKNRNGKIDGASELVGKSTTPDAKEEIFLNLPDDTTYWIYCHGCRIKTSFGEMNLKLSFDYAPAFIADFEPVGWVKERTATATAKFQTPFEVTHKDFSVAHNGKDVTASCRFERNHFFFMLPDTVKEGEKQRMVVTAKDSGGNEDVVAWEFIVDTVPPELEIPESPEDKEVAKKFSLQIKATDNAQLASVTYQLDNGNPVAFPKDKVEAINVGVLSLPDGEHKFIVRAADAAGNETSREVKFTVKNPPVAVASVSPADGAKISDDRPVMRVNLWSRAEIDAKSVKMTFNGEDVTEKMRYVATSKQILFIPPFLARGKHTVSVSFADTGGNKIESSETTFEVE